MMYKDILDHLPYKSTFRFVDRLTYLSEDEVKGEFTLRKDAFFYEDHFPGNPVTPGVILTEIMAQIGLVTLGIYLVVRGQGPSGADANLLYPLLTSTEVSFHKMVLPGDTVYVHSQKQYFRFGKLKCMVVMTDSEGRRIAEGIFSGVIKHVNQPVP
ncbi:3-hydroxyacyl-ACP dehydratase FabZ family protein [Dinghuibacter silviterrae]|uniref:3-hydroxyacyl-[acyl-carrier-protein] dehydratase n=1 Tax=Dinghuibacter silviterrae TaxID=1539049 RepID=A0A4R8DTV2_9BACT|nr:3-hydroxyacyl-ACP dehydratase FabZ family protein [Dinghuibacter silviterrae]TDX01346.1 3-hydroxyacyl-[acyl-carrier-protein] dehydratase [Dinghuibacter silviterrae]